jgi:hypothetical protein
MASSYKESADTFRSFRSLPRMAPWEKIKESLKTLFAAGSDPTDPGAMFAPWFLRQPGHLERSNIVY